MGGQLPVFLLLLFLSVFFISQALIMPSAGKKVKHRHLVQRIKESHKNIDQESVSLLKENSLKNLSSFERFLIRFSLFEVFKKKLELAGINIPFGKFIFFSFISGVISALVLIFLDQAWYISLGCAAAIWLVEYFIIQNKIASRLMKFEEQLPEALDIIKRVLQAGQPINQAFGEVGNEMPAPIGPEFKNTFSLLNYGYDMRLAVMQMSERVPTVSMMAFSSAVLLQKETGGNLVENIEKVSMVLRDRFKLTRKIKTISAESRMSAWFLVLSPFVMYFVIAILNPEYIAALHHHPIGIKMVLGGMISLFIGSMWIRKIVSFEV